MVFGYMSKFFGGAGAGGDGDSGGGRGVEVSVMVEGGRRVKIEKLPIRYYAHYLGDEIICTSYPSDRQFTNVTNLHVHPEPKIKVEKVKPKTKNPKWQYHFYIFTKQCMSVPVSPHLH